MTQAPAGCSVQRLPDAMRQARASVSRVFSIAALSATLAQSDDLLLALTYTGKEKGTEKHAEQAE